MEIFFYFTVSLINSCRMMHSLHIVRPFHQKQSFCSISEEFHEATFDFYAKVSYYGFNISLFTLFYYIISYVFTHMNHIRRIA